MEELYDKRLNSNGIAKVINKIILNSGFGRFGMSIIKPETDILNFYDLQALLTSNRVLDTKQLTEDSFIVTYENEVDKELLAKSGVDFGKFFNENSDKDLEKKNFKFVKKLAISRLLSKLASFWDYLSKLPHTISRWEKGIVGFS